MKISFTLNEFLAPKKGGAAGARKGPKSKEGEQPI
jgi:hypothetical protein